MARHPPFPASYYEWTTDEVAQELDTIAASDASPFEKIQELEMWEMGCEEQLEDIEEDGSPETHREVVKKITDNLHRIIVFKTQLTAEIERDSEHIDAHSPQYKDLLRQKQELEKKIEALMSSLPDDELITMPPELSTLTRDQRRVEKEIAGVLKQRKQARQKPS